MSQQLALHGINVKEFGATGDDRTDDAPAIQKALDSGSPLIVVPAGTYRISQTLRLASGTRLHLHPLAHIRLADGAGTHSEIFLVTNSDHRNGNHGIEIEGGIWDGNNPANPRGPDVPGSYTGVALNFSNVRNLTLRNLRVRDAESYHVRISEVRDFLIENIRFESPHLRPNQDGVHVCGCCEDGIIRNISARGLFCTNDDLVALLADDAMHRAQNLGGKCGPIRRLRIENLSAEDCHSFLRLGSVWSPITDIEVNHVTGGCRCNAVNADALRYCLVPVFDSNDPRFSRGVGRLENISLNHFRVHRTGGRDPLLRLETRMKNFRIRHFERNLPLDAAPSAPALRLRHVESPEIVLTGLTETDRAELQRSIPAEDLTLQIQATPSPLPLYRAVFASSAPSTIESHSHSLPEFFVTDSTMAEIPEPPTGWTD